MPFKQISQLSSPVSERVEPVGPAFLAHARRVIRNRTWSEHERIEFEEQAKLAANTKTEETDEFVDIQDDDEILQHDPKDWKGVDQYAALGLHKLRWRATEDQIRRAHRRQALLHHPDKKAAAGIDSDGFFKIVQKAFEVLSDPTRRRQWDSVDKKANVPVPKKATDFFEKYGPVFESEGRFSTKQSVPKLGSMQSPKSEVDAFYAFWYSFDSWRSFEWLDEDVPDDSSNRDSKRHIEKKNKSLRAKHKKDDNLRLRKLVDAALAEDPRIQAFKDAEKKAKEQKKWDREAGAREAAEKERKAKEEAESKAKADAAAAVNAKKAKEQAKSAKKKNKRAIRGSVKDLEGSLSTHDAALMGSDVDALIDAFDDLQLAEAASVSANLKGDALKQFFSVGLKQRGITAMFFV